MGCFQSLLLKQCCMNNLVCASLSKYLSVSVRQSPKTRFYQRMICVIFINIADYPPWLAVPINTTTRKVWVHLFPLSSQLSFWTSWPSSYITGSQRGRSCSLSRQLSMPGGHLGCYNWGKGIITESSRKRQGCC